MNTHTNDLHTTIVGAGWAGLAAALKLSKHNIPITLIEAAPQAGGRARSITHKGLYADNGQHLLLGAYQGILSCLQWLDIDEDTCFTRQKLTLTQYKSSKPNFVLSAGKFRAPIHMLTGILFAKGLSLSDKIQLLKFCWHIKTINYTLTQDETVATLLARHQQSKNTIEKLWEPLCLAALTTPIQIASANLFLSVLKDSFEHAQEQSDLLFPKMTLSEIFPEHVVRYLKQQSMTEVHLNTRVSKLILNENRVTEITYQGHNHPINHLIIATHPTACTKLLQEHEQLHPVAHDLRKLCYQPITTVYLQFDAATRLPQPMQGLLNGPGQWVFDRYHCGQPGLLAVVISCYSPKGNTEKTALIDSIHEQLLLCFPKIGKLLHASVICEKFAAFTASVNNQSIRKAVAPLPFTNCLLAGDYTWLPYPSTLEGAVQSGLKAAQLIIDKQKPSD